MNQAPTDRTRIRRVASNAHYDSTTLHAIIDDAYLCHIAFSDARGAHCIPTACWRGGEHLYIHGSNGSRMVRHLLENECCVSITHLDGLVLARSAFNHSMNYRSAMIYGRFQAVEGADARYALETLMEKLTPGRQADIRPGSDKEYAATTVLRIALTEAACKVRRGGPDDDETDLAWPAWAGVLPWTRAPMAPQPDPACTISAPAYVSDWLRRG
ncbi:pyridoxamine 5'-phosphate oxidase family protein [Duganella sp. sic0402]|uniref:pyridoxamine 5'-phosphate oxidase family protein n=1 Tax=Duganella sp. sic0402 TaxID=2854786 RepID=UPI001C486866|nr:pyridoxamine 5'-phosphate oxidase family protein [Duganella sp. sic0402]MBV7539089.1 pyridoxamine 5'-phosphate oxidase family protein [Duganella sp. sic0402]